jgi:hypothetical protein
MRFLAPEFKKVYFGVKPPPPQPLHPLFPLIEFKTIILFCKGDYEHLVQFFGKSMTNVMGNIRN